MRSVLCTTITTANVHVLNKPCGLYSRNFHPSSMSAIKKPWIDPTSLPRYGDATVITGNASDDVKQLTSNTLGAYGVGGPDNFAYSVGRKIALVSHRK